MKFGDKYVSGFFLSQLYHGLEDCRCLLRSFLYDEPCSLEIKDVEMELFVLLLQMEEMKSY